MRLTAPLRVALIVAFLAVRTAVVSVYVAYHGDIDQAFKRISTRSQIVQTACGPIEYAIAGEGNPVLIVHGAGGGFDQGRDFAWDLTAANLRVIAMSRFGYLRTPLPANASAAAQADAHACLLDALGIRRAAIVDVSAGAPSSMQFASASGALRGARPGCSGRLRTADPGGPVDEDSGLDPVLVRHSSQVGFSLLGRDQARAINND